MSTDVTFTRQDLALLAEGLEGIPSLRRYRTTMKAFIVRALAPQAPATQIRDLAKKELNDFAESGVPERVAALQAKLQQLIAQADDDTARLIVEQALKTD